MEGTARQRFGTVPGIGIDIQAAILPAIVLCGQIAAPLHQQIPGTPGWDADAASGAVSLAMVEPEGPGDRTLQEPDQQDLESQPPAADLTGSCRAALDAASSDRDPTESARYTLAPKQGPPA